MSTTNPQEQDKLPEGEHSLNKFFDLAKTDKPVMDEQAVRALLRSDSERSLPFTITQKRILIMSLTAICSIAVIGLYLWNGTNNVPSTHKVLVVNPKTVSSIASDIPKNIEPVQQSISSPGLHEITTHYREAKTQYAEPVSNNNVAIGPIPTQKPIELTEEQLHKLGIRFEDCKVAYFKTKAGSNVAVKAGVIGDPTLSFDRASIAPHETDGLSLPTFSPALVTTISGEKRMFEYTGGDQLTRKLRSIFGLGPNANVSVNGQVNNEPSDVNRGEKTLNDGKPHQKMIFKTVRVIDTNGVVHRDSVNEERNLDMNQSSIDSLLRSMGIDPKEAKPGTREVMVNVEATDSSNQFSPNRLWATLHDSSNTAMFQQLIKEYTDYKPELDKLIPVHVKNARCQNNDLIFWYRPTSEFFAAIPKNTDPIQLEASAHPALISSSLVYPNPIRSNATVYFETTAAHQLTASIYNLLGAKLMDVGHAETHGKETGSISIDVQSLPAGLYLLSLTTETGEQTLQRIIVEH